MSVYIKSITECGESETYDIGNFADDCLDGEGNFVLDGMIVHNSIPEAVRNRDSGTDDWKDDLRKLHPELLRILEDTYGTICYQEQLASIWQIIGGFTSPEAQDARKAVAKKWKHLLLPIENKWLTGASKTIGMEAAKNLWQSMVSFARYAFNKSHAVAYCLVAYRCLYLKARFPCEWWAAVMSDCHPDKLVRYMAVAKAEGAVFHSFNINNLTVDFGVKGDSVTLGLIGLKKVGRNMAEEFVGQCDPSDIDDFVSIKGKNKTVLERLIKLGAFDHLDGHHNRKAVWTWYQFKYCSGKDITQLKKDIKRRLVESDGWTEQSIAEERQEQVRLYKSAYPKRSNIPKKILEWQPDPDPTRERVLGLIGDDCFTTDELLTFEKQYLGYYMSNPLDRYECNRHCAFSEAREYGYGRVHGIVREVDFGLTKKGKEMCRLRLFDGQEQHLVLLWDDDCDRYRKVLEEAKESLARPDAGMVRHESAMEVKVRYSPKTSKFPESYTIWKEPKFKNYGAYTRQKSEYDLEMRGDAVIMLPLKKDS